MITFSAIIPSGRHRLGSFPPGTFVMIPCLRRTALALDDDAAAGNISDV